MSPLALDTTKNDDENSTNKEKTLPIISYLLKTKLASETEKVNEIINDLIKQSKEHKEK